MVKRLWQTWSKSLLGGAFILGVASLLSRLAGLIRDNVFSHYFGPTLTTDIYNAAFILPDFIFNVLVLGALAASFIPVFVERKHVAGEAAAFRLASTVLNWLTISLVGLVILAFFFTPWLANFLMAEHPAAIPDTIQLMRLLLISVICFGVSNVCAGILQSYRHYLAYALAPILYNVGIIMGAVWFYPQFGIVGLAYGAILGALLHMSVQWIAVCALGFRYTSSWSLDQPGLKTILRLMPPRALALGIAQINLLVVSAFALRLPAGSLTMWKWADNLQQVPINMIGVSLALSTFPVFSQAFAEQDIPKFKQIFSENFRRLLFVIIPISLGIMLLRAQFVRLILGSIGSGNFTWEATTTIAQVLGIFAIALFAQATIPMLARSFFAHQDTLTTVAVSILTVLLNAGLAVGLVDYLGLYGLALAFTVSSIMQMFLLLFFLRIKFGDLNDLALIKTIWRVVLASLAMGLVIHGLKYAVAPWVDMRSTIGLAVQTIVAAGGGMAVYLGIAYYLQYPEVDIVRRYLRKLWRR